MEIERLVKYEEYIINKKNNKPLPMKIPTHWKMIACNSLILDAAKRGLYFSKFYVGPLKERSICLTCGGLINNENCSMNCICNYLNNHSLTPIRRLCKNVMYFIHELLIQDEGKSIFFPENWPKIIIDNSEEERRDIILKRMQISRLRTNYDNGAFKIYTKKSSLKKLADFLEDIVIDIAKKY